MEKIFDIDVQAAALAQAFAGLAGDLAVVLDAHGQVLAAAGGAAAPGEAPGEGRGGWEGWTGHPWQALVAADSRVKAEALVSEALQGGQGRRREMNLCRRSAVSRTGSGGAGGAGETAAFSCSALRLGGRLRDARVLVVGRDLHATVAMQQQLLSRQAELETAYWAVQRAEPRA